ncbi:MAG: SEC-C metal-binding domain-containing protein [Chloroflexota bacterium]|nr:SEC-C metal-binding domain-containing protein [Chloroflexota bacterium]
MNPRDTDLEWLASNFPELAYAPADQRICGELRFCAAFDRSTGQLKLGDTGEHREIGTFLCDRFKVRIDLGRLGNNGWPTVFEVGGRRFDIAEESQCAMVDLHFFEDGACCLSLKYAREKDLTLQRFILELVIPFFYRLAYTDRYGLSAAKDDLWGEYPHGVAGEIEYQDEILQLVGNKPGRNRPCPCGSGLKYKRCHLAEVEAVKRRRLR